MIKNLIKLSDKLEKQNNKVLANRIDKILNALAQAIEGQISAKDLVKVQPDDKRKHHMLRALVDLIDFDIIVEKDKQGMGNFVRVIPKIQAGKTDGLNLGDLSSMPGISQFLKKELIELPSSSPLDSSEHTEIDKALKSLTPTKEESEEHKPVPMLGPDQFQYYKGSMINNLIKMADKFDQEGKYEMAEKIDSALKNLVKKDAARPKAPLKGLKDDVKKNLVLFIIDADKNMSSGIGRLKELFRRLRYFDLDDSVRDLCLDKVVKEMEKTQSCLDSAKKSFYTLVFGKTPSRDELEELAKTLKNDKNDEDDGQSALDFFGQNAEGPEVTSDDCESFTAPIDDEDKNQEDEELLKEFWSETEENMS
jgi:hypothetical protein